MKTVHYEVWQDGRFHSTFRREPALERAKEFRKAVAKEFRQHRWTVVKVTTEDVPLTARRKGR